MFLFILGLVNVGVEWVRFGGFEKRVGFDFFWGKDCR